MPLAYSPEDSRRYERDAVECQTQIWGTTLPPSPVTLVNISPSGCMLRCDQLVSIGESLTIALPTGSTLRGRAIWSGGARIGVEFDTPISEDEYRPLLLRLKAC